jgi:hypothetical protein
VVVVASCSPPCQTSLELDTGGRCSSYHPHWFRSNGSPRITMSSEVRVRSRWFMKLLYGQRTKAPQHGETQHTRQWRVLPTYTMRGIHAHETSRKAVLFVFITGLVEFLTARLLHLRVQRSEIPNLVLSAASSGSTITAEGDLWQEKVEITALPTTPSGVWPTRSACLMKTRPDGVRVICASRRRWRLASTGFVSKVLIRDATRADRSNLQFVGGVAQSRN